MPLELAIILPTLNESGNLGPLVERIDGALGSSGWEVLIVDDNSADGPQKNVESVAVSTRTLGAPNISCPSFP